MKTEINIEETESEETLLPTDVESSRYKMQNDNSGKKDSENGIKNILDTEDVKQSSEHLDETQSEVTINTGNDVTDKTASTEDADQGLSSNNIVQIPRSMIAKSSGSSQSDDEPATKKRRISASAFLELSEPNTNIDTNVIPQNISEDMKAYIKYTTNENVPNHFLLVVSNLYYYIIFECRSRIIIFCISSSIMY